MNAPFKVYMKRNHFFNILKVRHFKDTISKFEPCLKKYGDFIAPKHSVHNTTSQDDIEQ